MDRRGFLLAAGALTLAGCARVSAEPTPSVSATPSAAPMVIGTDPSATGSLVAALLVAALTKKGVSATVQGLGADWVSQLQSGSLAVATVFATTTWAQLSDQEEPSEDVIADLAGLVEPGAVVLAPGALDGGLVWLTAPSSGVSTLDDVGAWSVGKKAAVPSMAIERADGMGALNTIYGANFAAEVQEDPVLRAQAVAGGQAAIGAFRRTEYTGGLGLVELADPDRMCSPDLMVLAANQTFTDQQPVAALTLNAVLQALKNAELATMQAQLAQGRSADQVAADWLSWKRLPS